MAKFNKPFFDLVDISKPVKRQVVHRTTMEIDKLVITQANYLAKSAHQMTLQEKRLLFLVMSYIRQNDNDFMCYHIPVTIIKEYLGINDKDIYNRLQGITDRLLSRIVKIEKENGGWRKFQWVSYCEYIPKKESAFGDACIEIQLHDHLKPLLLNLKKYFGSMHLRQIASMSSINSIRIFEILYYSSMRLTKKTIDFTVENLKEILGLTGKYTNFRDFRKDVLAIAQRECKIHTLLTFTWKEEKKGRKIVMLRFKIRKNNKFKDEIPPRLDQSKISTTASFSIKQSKILNFLKENKIDKTIATNLVRRFSLSRVIDNIKLAQEKFTTDKSKDLPTLIVTAINEDWSNQIIMSLEPVKQDINSNTKNEYQKIEEPKKNIENNIQEYTQTIIDSWNKQKRQVEIESFLNQADDYICRQYRQSGMRKKSVRATFRNYIRKKYIDS